MNRICIVGRLTDMPKSREVGTQLVAEFCVAVGRMKKEETDFFNVKIWGKQAEFVMNYLSKGRLVSVSGRMESRKHEKDGKTTTYWDVVADQVNGLDRKEEGAPKVAPDIYGSFTYKKTPAPPPPLPGETDLEDPFA